MELYCKGLYWLMIMSNGISCVQPFELYYYQHTHNYCVMFTTVQSNLKNSQIHLQYTLYCWKEGSGKIYTQGHTNILYCEIAFIRYYKSISHCRQLSSTKSCLKHFSLLGIFHQMHQDIINLLLTVYNCYLIWFSFDLLVHFNNCTVSLLKLSCKL